MIHFWKERTYMKVEKGESQAILYTGRLLYPGFSADMEGISQFGMIIRNGRITAIGTEADLVHAEYERRIDLGDGVVIPGLIDCHVHLFLDPLKGSGSFNPGEPGTAVSLLAGSFKNSSTLLSRGVTTCRDLGAWGGLNTALRNAVEEGILDGPDIVSAGVPLSVTGGHGCEMGGACDGADGMRQMVRSQVGAGADLIKLMVSGGVNSPGPEPGPMELTREELNAAVDTARAHGRKVAVHTHGAGSIRASIEAGVNSIEHGVFLEEESMQLMAEKGIFLVPTLSAPHYAVSRGLEEDPDNPDHERSRQVVERHKQAALQAHDKGVRIAMGSDAGTPFNEFTSAPFEILLMIRSGFSIRDALKSATEEGAALLGLEQSKGLLKVGMQADFLLLPGDPLQNPETLLKVSRIWKNGTEYPNNR
jgi:imidazolonepropionase-like amidohydrolase